MGEEIRLAGSVLRALVEDELLAGPFGGADDDRVSHPSLQAAGAHVGPVREIEAAGHVQIIPHESVLGHLIADAALLSSRGDMP